MNGIRSRKVNNIEKPFPGCLGRMVNLFDLSSGIAGNRLLSDRPHREGIPISRSQSEVTSALSPPFGNQVEDKKAASELLASSNKKVNGTPMKMLIAEEMTKEVDGKRTPHNLVAKLMGLEALPQYQPDSAALRSHSKVTSRRSLSHSSIPSECWQLEDSFQYQGVSCETHPCPEQNFKDVYEIQQQFWKVNHVKEDPPQKERHNENVDVQKMDLIRQKLMQEKCLSTDEKLHHSKELHDALELLNSNKDLFKLLQEPNSLFSQHLNELQATPPPPETKRITVLRPSKMVENEKFFGLGKKGEKQIKKSPQMFPMPGCAGEKSRYCPNLADQNLGEHAAQPTRIVVLKPGLAKTYDIKAPVSPPCMSPRIEDLNDESQDNEIQASRQLAAEVTQQMQGNLMGLRKDETLLSSVFSNGYVGDESSFNKSDNEYVAESLSDSEVISPTSRHSYVNKFGCPYSPSSFSRASCSSESSVSREAKKRLSERWALMASNGSTHETNVRKGSSTLGEMLALLDTKKLEKSEVGSVDKDKPRGSTSSLTVSFTREIYGDSPRNLSRSKSVPMSLAVSDSSLTNDTLDSEANKTHASKELTKSKSMKLSLKGKVSSIFFSRNKKPSKEKLSTACKDEYCCDTMGIPSGNISDTSTQPADNGAPEEKPPSLHISSGYGQKWGAFSKELDLPVAQHVGSEKICENQDQPSPMSVLEPPFEEDVKAIPESSSNMNPEHLGTQVLMQTLKSNLIDKSPLIGTIARTLSWDDSCTETAAYPLSERGLEEDDWLFLVQKLLLMAGLDADVQSDSLFTSRCLHGSLLDPSLRDRYSNLNGKEPVNEAKQRRDRANWKLVFDCVNAALLEITGYGLERNARSSLHRGAHSRLLLGESPVILDLVWAQVKECFSGKMRCVAGHSRDSDSLVVEQVLSKEVFGSSWVEQLRMEGDDLGKEIEGKLLEELVEEAVVALTG